MGFSAQLFDCVDVLPIIGIIDKSAEMDVIALRQMLEQMVGADLVPLVGRVGHAVNKEKEMFHRHPRFLTICGPIALATDSGKRCHILMNN